MSPRPQPQAQASTIPYLDAAGLRTQLMAWYGAGHRNLPWRATDDPYAIWVSEIMLQQTRASVAADHYRAFIERFPTLSSLADAADQEVLARWSGLGYYNRARMLHKAARFVMSALDGVLPRTAAELRTLPGIGSYTAAAIASIAHGEAVGVVDGNVERVIARLVGIDLTGKGAARRQVEAVANQLVDPRQPGEFNQAMMELGATICLPRKPSCGICPVVEHCQTRGEHATPPRPRMTSRKASYALIVRKRAEPQQGVNQPLSGPVRANGNTDVNMGLTSAGPKQRSSSRRKTVANIDSFLHREILLEQRPVTQTVMAGMWELPALASLRVPAGGLQMSLRHAIMQVNYDVDIRSVMETDADQFTVVGGERRWVRMGEAWEMALTGLTRKVLRRAQLIAISSQAIVSEDEDAG